MPLQLSDEEKLAREELDKRDPMIRINIEFRQSMLAAIDEVAREEFQTRSYLIREAVRQKLLRGSKQPFSKKAIAEAQALDAILND